MDSEKLKIDLKEKDCQYQRRIELHYRTTAQREDEPRTTEGKLPGKDELCLELVNNIAIKAENFDPNKREFYNAFSRRYRWTLKYMYLPYRCPCGKRFDVDHAMSCTKGGFVHRRHDDVRDLFASLIMDVYPDFEVEPHVQTLTGELFTSSANSSDEARLVSLRAVFGKGGNLHFLMSGFLTLSQSCLNQKLYTAFSSNENAKKATVQPANY